MQPLDVAVFYPLKNSWGKILFERLQSVRSKLSKKEFSELLASDEVWGVAFTKENIEADFRKCGIYPVNREEYPINRFSPPVLEKYEKWIADGPEPNSENLGHIADEEGKKQAKEDKEDEVIEHNGEQGTVVSFFVPLERPAEMIRLAKSPNSTNSKSFRELCLQRLDAAPKRPEKAPVPRKGINPYGAIVTSDAEYQKVQEEVEKIEMAVRKKEEAKKIKAEAKLAREAAKEEKRKEQEEKKKTQEERRKERDEKDAMRRRKKRRTKRKRFRR